MAHKIKIKRSNVASRIPAVSDLDVGEIALNMADAKIFFKDPSNAIKEISGTSQLNSLTDVNITGLADGKILKWDATTTKWVIADDSGLSYTTQIPTGTTKLRLDGSDSSTDDIEFAGSGSTTVTRTNGSKLTISSTDTTYPTLASIPDVNSGATNGQVLKWNSTTSKWAPSDDSVGTTINAINDIGDVNAGSPSDGQVLTWNNSSSKWVSATSSGGVNYTNGSTAPSSPNLGDEFFDTTTDILYKWVNDGSSNAWIDISTDSSLSIASIDDVNDVDTSTAAPTSGQVLKWNGSNWTPADDVDTTLSLGTVDLTDIGDVSTGATNGQVLKWNSTTSKWTPSDDTDTDTVYTHPTTAGNKHIPTGGSAGQVLKYSASGTAVWANDDAGILQDLSTTTVGTSAVTVDSWDKSTYLSAKYTVTCKVGTKFSTSEVLVLNKGGSSVEITEYASLGDDIVTLTADTYGSNVRLRAVSTDASTSVKLTKILQGV